MDNIPVFGAESIVHLNADGSCKKITDKFVRDIAIDAAPNPDISPLRLLRAYLPGTLRNTSSPVLDGHMPVCGMRLRGFP